MTNKGETNRNGKNEKPIRGFLHYAPHGEIVRRFVEMTLSLRVSGEDKQRQQQMQMRGFFAALRMTATGSK